jgi:hypothetical protein
VLQNLCRTLYLATLRLLRQGQSREEPKEAAKTSNLTIVSRRHHTKSSSPLLPFHIFRVRATEVIVRAVNTRKEKVGARHVQAFSSFTGCSMCLYTLISEGLSQLLVCDMSSSWAHSNRVLTLFIYEKTKRYNLVYECEKTYETPCMPEGKRQSGAAAAASHALLISRSSIRQSASKVWLVSRVSRIMASRATAAIFKR